MKQGRRRDRDSKPIVKTILQLSIHDVFSIFYQNPGSFFLIRFEL